MTDLIQRSGLRAETTLRVIKHLDQTEFDVNLDAVPAGLREALEADQDALTYQFFVVARPIRDGQGRADGSSLPEHLRARIDRLAAELEKAGGYARSLESELQAKDELIKSESAQALQVAALTAELDRAAVYARHLEAEIANRDQRIGELETRIGAEVTARVAEQAARQQADEIAARTLGLEEIVADVRRLLDDQVNYARYLEAELQRRTGEVAVRDDELHVLRAHIQKTEQAIAERDARLHGAAGSQAELRDLLEHRLHQLTTARQLIADRENELGVAARTSAGLAAALAEERRRISDLCELVRQHRIRLAARTADGFVQSAPRLYRLLRPVLVASLARWRPDENPR